MESHQIWRQMKSHEYDHHRRLIHSENQVDLTLRLGFPDGSAVERPDIDHHNNPFFSTAFHNINHHPLQTHQVMVDNHGSASSGGRNGEMMSEANYNPHQIVWSKELKTYVLKSNDFGQLHPSSYSNTHQAKPIATTPNNSPNLPLPKYNNDLYTLLNPASRITDDHEAEASSGGRRRGSRRRRVSANNDAERRCTNYNCNTNFTPMWRKGPLGPKSLCNACGIRYRKETLNREAMAAENSSG
ncbi:putative GATA transcription factor 22 [Benincasa hispida]|uniref:putative GATA transcription factor 22 n=1 Tax=Benincasa hispida TaxID=102211 RepID=UPI0019017FFC|nr:putative GATA transcription factor 22 [Benincasa hispida]